MEPKSLDDWYLDISKPVIDPEEFCSAFIDDRDVDMSEPIWVDEGSSLNAQRQ